MKKPRRRAKLGDVLEVLTPKGYGYVQYAHKHPIDGPTIRVLEGLFRQPQLDAEALANLPTLFWCFFWVGSAVWRGEVRIVGSAALPESARRFPTMRSSTISHNGEAVHSWWITEDDVTTHVTSLTTEEKKLSPGIFYSLSSLIKDIAQQLRPEQHFF